jgi:DNA-binding winged helix-turn-helix (wHTH) protein
MPRRRWGPHTHGGAMPVVDEHSYCFEGFTLDLRRGALRDGENDIDLRPKCFEVLRYLVCHAGRLVSKDELATAVWPNVTGTDESLTRCMSEVRHALGNSGQRIIETVPRRGYRFVASVSVAMPEERPAPPAAQPPSGGPDPASVIPSDRGQARADPAPAELRQLPVLVCKLAGLAALSAQLDPEDFSDKLAQCLLHFSQVIERHRGYVAHHDDAGLVAYFGYPNADEQASEHAVRAGLTLVGPPDSGGLERSLQPRIGVASGIVVIGRELGAGATADRAVGETPTLARRLSETAPSDGLVIAQSTRRLIGELFEYREVDGPALADGTERIRAYEVLRASEIDSRYDALRGAARAPLVGRDEELGFLERRWRQVREGEGKVALVSGEPGIGKSRLIAEFEARLEGEATRLHYFCSPDHTEVPLFPVMRQLARTAAFERADTASQRFAKLAAALQLFSVADQEDMSLLADLLSLPAEGRPRPREMSAQKRKERTLAASLRQLERAARHRPVLAIFEDVHWIDPTTRELLDMAIERSTRLPVLLILTFRPEFSAPWVGQAHVTPLTVNRLARRNGMSLVEGMSGGQALSKEMVTGIVDRADGVPLFLEELTKGMVEAGATGSEGGHPLPAMPATLDASLMSRLERLGSYAKEITQIGAAIGREFPYDLLALVARMEDGPLRDGLTALNRAGLLLSRGMPPYATFLFNHALLQECAYGLLLRERRKELHARIAAALEGHFQDIVKMEPGLLALHCARAGLTEKATTY